MEFAKCPVKPTLYSVLKVEQPRTDDFVNPIEPTVAHRPVNEPINIAINIDGNIAFGKSRE